MERTFKFEIFHTNRTGGPSGQYSGTDIDYIRKQRKGFQALGYRCGKIIETTKKVGKKLAAD